MKTNNTAEKEITAPVILTDEQWRAQFDADLLQRYLVRNNLMNESKKCEGVVSGLTQALRIMRGKGLAESHFDELTDAIFAAHDEWAAANKAWSETL